MIDFINLLTDDDYLFLKDKMDNFIVSDTPNGTDNFYVRSVLDVNTDLFEFRGNVEEYVNKKMGSNYTLKSMWINRITNETNQNDKFHFDSNDLTILTFLNEDFDGGYFEYNNNNQTTKFAPQTKNSIIMNDKLLHRVSPVTQGVRYTLVMFYNYIMKNQKSLI